MDVKNLYDIQFFNEAAILSGVRHKNLVRLLGCTDPRSENLHLIYEFVPNGTVAKHLHGQGSTLTWDVRLQISVETADALAYLHSLEPPIIHRNVKTSNILLENDLHVKVADFGVWRLSPWDATYNSTLPQGTMGYRGPEYDRTLMLSDKSDVYSFGVVLLELMSGMEAVDISGGRDDINLVDMALKKIKSFRLKDIVDPTLGYHSDANSRRMINSVAELARECLRPEGKMRPTMVQVLKALTDIQDKRYKIHDRIVDGAQAYVFSLEELSQATESFNESRRLGKRGKSVYLGYFDGLMVVVKERGQCDRDITELQVRHKHLASRYGFTIRDSKGVMFSVYEYVANSSVGCHLHGPSPQLLIQIEERIALDWDLRIRIAIETAEALSYLHSFELPIIFGQFSTYGILLDENNHVKLNLLQWSPYEGYPFMPYYRKIRAMLIGMKAEFDVYSFGVVLFELISGSPASGNFHEYLANGAPNRIKRNELDQSVDGKLDYHSNSDTKRMVNSVAKLACRCVLPDEGMRPTMPELYSLLKEIQDGRS